TIVPAMMITSACRGVALATSNPNLDQSYFAEAVLIISIAQQLVPNTKGHNEFERAQLITSSSLLSTIPPPAVGCTAPGKIARSLSSPPVVEEMLLSPLMFCDSFIFPLLAHAS